MVVEEGDGLVGVRLRLRVRVRARFRARARASNGARLLHGERLEQHLVSK